MLIIRQRVSADLPGCAVLLEGTHVRDGYPRYRHDWVEFVSSGARLMAWVAELDGEIVGHVAVKESAGAPTTPLARAATGLPDERLAVLTRLVTGQAARRRGVARQLVETGLAFADEHRLRLALDVVVDADAAIALYERLGWRRLGPVTVAVQGCPSLACWAYLSPATPQLDEQ